MREENLVWREEKDPAYFGHLDQKSPPAAGERSKSWEIVLREDWTCDTNQLVIRFWRTWSLSRKVVGHFRRR